MDYAARTQVIQSLFAAIEQRLGAFLENAADRNIADGNLSIHVVDQAGNVWGKFLGTDRVKQRGSGMVGWQKVMQVWLTGVGTGAYEKQVYGGKKNWWEYGIPLPELIGWEGGLPAAFSDGTPVAIAVSGLRGEQDCALIAASVAAVDGLTLLSREG